MDLVWKIIILGWEYFCRDSLTQIKVLSLMIRYQEYVEAREVDLSRIAGSKEEVMRDPSSPVKLNKFMNTKRSPQRVAERATGAQDEESTSLYSTLLQPCFADKFQSPLDLFYTKFFRHHPSFYDLEVLTKSLVASEIFLI